MPRLCSLCTHPKQVEVDAAISGGTSYRNIAERYGTSPGAISRHKAHIVTALAIASEQREAVVVEQAVGLLGSIAQLQDEARRLGMLAEKHGDLKTALQAVREIVRMVELVAKAQGEIGDGSTTVNVALVQAPEWHDLRARIVAALAPFPEAQAAVLEAIRA
jgi:hypothetical protein